MRGFRARNRLPLLGAIVLAVLALSAYGTLGAKLSGVGQRNAAPRAPQTARTPALIRPPLRAALPAPAQPPAAMDQPAGGALPARSSPARSSGADSPAAGPEPLGRANPFAQLVSPTPPSALQAGLPRPVSPRAGAPQFGVDLPLPPGFTPPAGQDATAPAPGADMTVGAIIGGHDRVAIIRTRDKVFVVGVGDKVGDAVVVDIKDNKVIMRGGGGTFELTFGGAAR